MTRLTSADKQTDHLPVLYSDLGPLSSWSFSEPSTSKHQGGSGRLVSIHASPGEKAPPLVQLAGDGEPFLVAPYGLTGPSEGSDRCNLELAVEHEPLKNFLNGLDAFFRQIATERCTAWFRKSLRPNEIESLQRPLLTNASSKCPHDLLRVKVPPSVRVWRVRSSSTGGWAYSQGVLEDVVRGCHCWVTVSVSSLYFLPRLFGCTLTARDILVLPSQARAFPFLTTVRTVLDEGHDDGSDREEGSRSPQEPAGDIDLSRNT